MKLINKLNSTQSLSIGGIVVNLEKLGSESVRLDIKNPKSLIPLDSSNAVDFLAENTAEEALLKSAGINNIKTLGIPLGESTVNKPSGAPINAEVAPKKGKK